MAMVYFRLIVAGLKTLDDVPERHKSEVQALLNA